IRIVLVVFIEPYFAVLYHMVEYNLFQFSRDIARFNLGVLDLLFDVFFLIGELFVLLTIALDVGLLL
ncbi:MAG: hypothetical protein AB2777_22500, partial [Candidatus Thiodiazotropha endolucinida]